jgi:preprotein translocase subunit SecG
VNGGPIGLGAGARGEWLLLASGEPIGIGAASGGEWLLFAGGAVLTVGLLVGTIVFAILIRREHRRVEQSEREDS